MARVTALSIEGAWLVETPVHHDNRGHFQEWFKESLILEAIGREFSVALPISRGPKGVSCEAYTAVNRHEGRLSGSLAPMALSGM